MVSTGMYGELPERSKQALSQVNSNIGRLIALVNGLLSLEKMESGHLQLDCSMIKVSAVVDPSVHSIQGMAQKRRIKLAVVNERDPKFYGDQDRLVQVLVNLLSNAIKFSPEKTTVTIAVEEGDDFVEVQVNDQGKGIPEDKREFVFERFKQVDREDETKKGGIGLGLPICKAIVEQHNGSIGVGTADGGGCRMWFRIPKASVALETEL
jgi:signal transduction histidine kinase